MIYFNPFVANASFLYPLQKSDNWKVFWCLQGVQKGCIGNKWVNIFMLRSKLFPIMMLDLILVSYLRQKSQHLQKNSTECFYMMGALAINRLTLLCIMLKYGQTYFKKVCGVHKAIYLKFVWPFFNIMHERVKFR